MKKTIVVCIILVILIIVYNLINNYIYYYTVHSFNFKDIEYIFENSTLDMTVEKINNAKDARRVAEKVFIEVFEEIDIEECKPLIVSYDKKEKIWFVYGNSHKEFIIPFLYSSIFTGGNLNVYIHESGKVLGFWIDK